MPRHTTHAETADATTYAPKTGNGGRYTQGFTAQPHTDESVAFQIQCHGTWIDVPERGHGPSDTCSVCGSVFELATTETERM